MNANGTGKAAVTHLGSVTAAPSWSPDGQTLAFGAGSSPQFSLLYEINATAPYGDPTQVQGYYTGCVGCDFESPADLHPIDVDRSVAWSPDGSRIAIFNHADGQLDDAIYFYDVATGEAAPAAGNGWRVLRLPRLDRPDLGF